VEYEKFVRMVAASMEGTVSQNTLLLLLHHCRHFCQQPVKMKDKNPDKSQSERSGEAAILSREDRMMGHHERGRRLCRGSFATYKVIIFFNSFNNICIIAVNMNYFKYI
jgi:hypothetical protein